MKSQDFVRRELTEVVLDPVVSGSAQTLTLLDSALGQQVV